MARIVVDTNLLVAGRWKPKSYSNRIIDLVLDGTLVPVYTKATKRENLYILSKVKPSDSYLKRVETFYSKGVEVNPKRHFMLSEDKDDNKFIDAAVEGNASYIISSDHHLLDLREVEGVRILNPSRFFKLLP